MKLGSLFTGYGGLDMAAAAFFDAETVWHSEIDPGACKILAHHWPDVPNLGDITAINWAAVEPVEILTGGFPCQDVSHAGKRAGLRPDTRTGLWSQMAYAIEQLRPRYVVAENVRGLLSASAHSDVEPCPWCMGGPADGEPVLRALGAVLGDLAELGYDSRWIGLRAADVGAPHGRFRVFILATDTQRERLEGPQPQRLRRAVSQQPVYHHRALSAPHPSGQSRGFGHGDDVRAGRGAVGREPATGRGIAADALGGRRDGGPQEPIRRPLRRVAAGGDSRGVDPATDADQPRPQRAEPARGRHLPDGSTAADAERGRIQRWREPGDLGGAQADGAGEGLQRQRNRNAADDRGAAAWGAYKPAIRRWEQTLGRLAPPPTETSPKGSQRLSPAFVEWMQGLPAGHVTAVPGLSRNEQLKALGNGVVPQQAYAALGLMLDRAEVAA